MTTFDFPVSKSAGVTRIDLGRPEEGNSLTRGMMRTLADRIRIEGCDASVNVIIIEAKGSHFCKGRDGRGENTAGMKPYEVREQMMGAVLSVYEAISSAQIPVLAKVQGPAIGFGAALAGACDLTLAGDTATFAFSEIKHGIPPTMAITAVNKKVGNKALSYLIYSGVEIGSQEAVAIGLVSRTFPATLLEQETSRLAADLASRPRLVLETIKKFMTHSQDLSPAMSAEYAGTLLALVRS